METPFDQPDHKPELLKLLASMGTILSLTGVTGFVNPLSPDETSPSNRRDSDIDVEAKVVSDPQALPKLDQ